MFAESFIFYALSLLKLGFRYGLTWGNLLWEPDIFGLICFISYYREMIWYVKGKALWKYYNESTQPKGFMPRTYSKAFAEFTKKNFKNPGNCKESVRDEVHS